jgi:two-component system, LytTR family, sensor kinase
MEQWLAILLVKLAVAASLASILSRSSRFLGLLLKDERTMLERLELGLGISAFCAAGATTRLLTNYQAVDLSLEGSLVAGMIGGYVPGLLTGVIASIPCMIKGEYLSMTLYAAVGVLGGMLRDLAQDPEVIWRFSPFFDLSLYRFLRYPADRRRSASQLAILFTILLAELLRETLARLFEPGRIFVLKPTWQGALGTAAIYVTTVFATSIPIKIWNSARNERLLDAKERLLTQAKLAALSSQINPHFLFNTLNTVSSLIRTNPEQARRVVYKLSHILRRLLRKHDNFSPLREEIAFIEDYLSIETQRFGDKLRIETGIDPATLDLQVPSMVLQPIVENSIKHGLSAKIEGGRISIRSELREGRLHLLVEDDGVGIEESRLAAMFDLGIGVSNVNERLKVLFGQNYRLSIHSKLGEGTRTEIDLPAPAGVAAAIS